MKKLLCAVLAACMIICLFSGCDTPNSLQMDLFQGYGRELKLIHLNASSGEKRERMEAFAQALADSQPVDKDISMFAYYPDYRLVISGKALASEEGGAGFTVADAEGRDSSITAVIDLNGDFVDFYFPGPDPEQSDTVYRSKMTAKEFRILVHHA